MDDWINPSVHRVELGLSSGLVLLARLRHLRRLQIRIGDPHKPVHLSLRSVDIDWMVASGYSEERRQERQVVMDSWNTEIQDDVKEHETGVAFISQVSIDNSRLDISRAEPELTHQLRHLGHRVNVVSMLEEMHSAKTGYIVWPKMEEASFYYPRHRGLALTQDVDRLLSPPPPPSIESKSPTTPQPPTRPYHSPALHSTSFLPALKRRFQRLAKGVLYS